MKRNIKKRNKKQNRDMKLDFDDETMDDVFCFIAGYTSGGVPYGTTFEEVGIDPSLPFEEKVRLYNTKALKDKSKTKKQGNNIELPF